MKKNRWRGSNSTIDEQLFNDSRLSTLQKKIKNRLHLMMNIETMSVNIAVDVIRITVTGNLGYNFVK